MKRRASTQLTLDTRPARRARTSSMNDALPPHMQRHQQPLLTTSLSNASNSSGDSAYSSDISSPSQHVPRLDPSSFRHRSGGYGSPTMLVSSPTFGNVPNLSPMVNIPGIPHTLLIAAHGQVSRAPGLLSPTGMSPSVLASNTAHVLQMPLAMSPTSGPLRMVPQSPGGSGMNSGAQSPIGGSVYHPPPPQILDFSSAVSRLQAPVAAPQPGQHNVAASLQEAPPMLSAPTFPILSDNSPTENSAAVVMTPPPLHVQVDNNSPSPPSSADNSPRTDDNSLRLRTDYNNSPRLDSTVPVRSDSRESSTRKVHSLSAPTQLSINTSSSAGTSAGTGSSANSPSTSQDLTTQISTLKRAGPYLLGPRLGTSPVRSIVQCLARKEGTDDFFCLKVSMNNLRE